MKIISAICLMMGAIPFCGFLLAQTSRGVEQGIAHPDQYPLEGSTLAARFGESCGAPCLPPAYVLDAILSDASELWPHASTILDYTVIVNDSCPPSRTFLQIYDIDAIMGDNYAHDLIQYNFDSFSATGSSTGTYAYSGAISDWNTLRFLMPGFLDDDPENGEISNFTLDYTVTEEVDANSGRPSGTGTPIGGLMIMEIDNGDGSFQDLYFCVPTSADMDCWYAWFRLPPSS